LVSSVWGYLVRQRREVRMLEKIDIFFAGVFFTLAVLDAWQGKAWWAFFNTVMGTINLAVVMK